MNIDCSAQRLTNVFTYLLTYFLRVPCSVRAVIAVALQQHVTGK